MAERFRAMRGTHDILPEESSLWRCVEDRFVDICMRYGFSEIRIPTFEATELFERGTGFATDVVQKEMYTFLDKKGRSVSLRPEATPGVIRAYLEHNLGKRSKITKLFYMGPMFRYDRPGAGRYRQFHQLGIETIGTAGPSADAETVQVLWDFLRGLNLGGLTMRINTLGCTDCRIRYSEKVKDFLADRLDEVCGDCRERYARNPLRVLDCKVRSCKQIVREAPEVGTILCPACIEHFDKVKALLDGVGIPFEVDPRLVRGLDYYTRTVFEVFHEASGADNSLGGGGRYDRLVEEIGGPSTPAVGFSAGIERILLALKSDKALEAGGPGVDVYVADMGEDASAAAYALAGRLRAEYRVWLEFEPRKLERQLRAASRLRARFTAIIGTDEMATASVRIKDMESGEQVLVESSQVLEWLAERIRG
jgi:histidyl-tRNA synthetase